MKQETVDLIIGWFAHIEQLATDRKTLTGATMDTQHCFNEIAALARDSRQFVEKYRYEESTSEQNMNNFMHCPECKSDFHFVDSDIIDEVWVVCPDCKNKICILE